MITTKILIYEICIDCPICEGIMVVKISGDKQVAEIFAPCSVCKILEKVI